MLPLVQNRAMMTVVFLRLTRCSTLLTAVASLPTKRYLVL